MSKAATRVRAAIIGSGNIGTDLFYKARRSEWIEPAWLIGIEPDSEGLRRAAALGANTTAAGIDGLLPHIARDQVRIAFDATSAHAHAEHARKLAAAGVTVIDLTPAAIGPYCVPPVNLKQHLKEKNVNMVSCGGQATIPMVAAVGRVQPVAYAEVVATVASRSIGPGTRQNIDEFTRTTARAVERIGGARRGKAIVIINPADPPLIMRNTIHCLTEGAPDRAAISASVEQMLHEVQRYVPGYQLKNGPVFDDKRVTLYLEVEGLGDYLPRYAGNLDIMTSAALRTGELFAEAMVR
jgi:acetaldehyde/propanal dehydrogenase